MKKEKKIFEPGLIQCLCSGNVQISEYLIILGYIRVHHFAYVNITFFYVLC